jgi:predicted DNA-binding transcriptional regulator AlpA
MRPADNLAMLGVSRQRVHQLTEEDPSFPKPAAELATGRVWETADIEKWAKATGRSVQG